MNFDDRVVIVTGAGGGLGRSYALELARRGARVAVVDPGGERDGTGGSGMAEAVADEVRAAGGLALSDRGSVTSEEDMAALVDRVATEWGRVDVLVNNAGILRDRSFARMTADEWQAVLDVHLTGSAVASRAVWPIMREQGRGRILMTTSSAGLYGNFGQANYAAAKLGLVGLAKTLSIEGARHGIKVNTIAPLAVTRMSQDVFPVGTMEVLQPEAVVAAAVFLVSDEAPTGAVLGAAGGHFHVARITMTLGETLAPGQWSPEEISAAWTRISDPVGEVAPTSSTEHFGAVVRLLSG